MELALLTVFIGVGVILGCIGFVYRNLGLVAVGGTLLMCVGFSVFLSGIQLQSGSVSSVTSVLSGDNVTTYESVNESFTFSNYSDISADVYGLLFVIVGILFYVTGAFSYMGEKEE
jgi:hypothetical protein